MPRWAGLIGYTRQVETSPGVVEDDPLEVRALGDLQQITETLRLADGVHATHGVTTSVSVISDGHRIPFRGMAYITYGGVAYTIASVVVEPPRMVIYLGEEYHGPEPAGPSGNPVVD